MEITAFQERINDIYGTRDRRRGLDATFRWLMEEVGELARALRTGDPQVLQDEIGDVLAWTVSIASLVGVDAARAVTRYAAGCPKCGAIPCACPTEFPGGTDA